MKRKSKEAKTPEKTILVGTYRKDQLEKWVLPKGLYNYAIHGGDAAIQAAAPSVSELWLYAGKKDKLRFSASFEREVSAAELNTLGYPRGRGKPHAERYLLFRVEKKDESSATKNTKDTKGISREVRQVRESKTSCRAAEGAEETSHRGTEAQREGACLHAPPSQGSASPRLRVANSATRPSIFVRLTDFKRRATKLAEIRQAMAELPDVKKAKDAKPFSYLDFLPDDILSDWSDRLCVCEAAEQLDFYDYFIEPYTVKHPIKHAFVDLFAGCGDSAPPEVADGSFLLLRVDTTPSVEFAQTAFPSRNDAYAQMASEFRAECRELFNGDPLDKTVPRGLNFGGAFLDRDGIWPGLTRWKIVPANFMEAEKASFVDDSVAAYRDTQRSHLSNRAPQPAKIDHPRLSREELTAANDLNEAVFNLYEHAAARSLDTLSPELAGMIEDAWKALQPVKRLKLLGRLTDEEFTDEKERDAV